MDRGGPQGGRGRGRGGFDRGRGRGGFDRGRGQGGFDQGGGRGAFDQGGGHRGHDRGGGHGGYRGRGGHGQGGYDRGRGGHGQGGYDRGRGGHDGGDRGLEGSSSDGGRAHGAWGSSDVGSHQGPPPSWPVSQGSSAVSAPTPSSQAWGPSTSQPQHTPEPESLKAVEEELKELTVSEEPTQTGGKKKGKGKKKVADTTEPEKKTPAEVPSEKAPEAGPLAKLSARHQQGKLAIPKRPIKPAVKGEKRKVYVNFFSMNFKKHDAVIYHYDVNFVPDTPKRLLRHVMEKVRVQFFPDRYPAFDGRKNLYSCGPLQFPKNQPVFRDSVSVNDEESQKDKEFDVTIKEAERRQLSWIVDYMAGRNAEFPQVVLQAIDIALRSRAMNRALNVGRSFFNRPPDGEIVYLEGGLELWRGFFQSAVLGWRAYLNVDVAHKGFPIEQTVIQYIQNELRVDPRQPLNNWAVGELAKFIKGLKIKYQIGNRQDTMRIYRVNDVREPANRKRFTTDSGAQKTVADYFRIDKNHPLIYPHLPLLHVGSRERDVCLPVELCTIIGRQSVNRKLNEKQTAHMVKAAARPTWERQGNIMGSLKTLEFRSDPYSKEFGIEIGTQMELIDARELTPPELQYQGRALNPSRGVWRAEGCKFFNSTSVQKWAVINLARLRPPDIQNLLRNLTGAGNAIGVTFEGTPVLRDGDPRDIKHIFKELESNNMELSFVIIPDRPPDVYSQVKRAAEIETNRGLLTQCMKSITATRKMNFSTAQNILLKVNAKLKGANHVITQNSRLDIFKRPVMIVGADVTHPSPDQTSIPSVAAVTASYDVSAFRYMMEYRLQNPRLEIISEFQAILENMLKEFRDRNRNNLPERIVYYRDGVSEGQFQQVMDSELVQMQMACKKIGGPSYEPRITFLVVQKRHHTRFFPSDKRFSDGKNANVMPGTVVDSMITHPTEFDFYLVSHASIQGTARPTKYHVLWDDANMSMDDVEQLTNHLCYLFARCNRAVSYPAPTYYAHYAAFRARAYMENIRLNPQDMDRLSTERHCGLVHNNIRLGSPMFFV